jgi:hypothetical protein
MSEATSGVTSSTPPSGSWSPRSRHRIPAVPRRSRPRHHRSSSRCRRTAIGSPSPRAGRRARCWRWPRTSSATRSPAATPRRSWIERCRCWWRTWSDGSSRSLGGRAPAGVRRTSPGTSPRRSDAPVFIRDRGRCRFISTRGRRCGERAFVEFHHLIPYAAGGRPTVENIALRCRAHDAYEAEIFYGPIRDCRSTAEDAGADAVREGAARVTDDAFRSGTTTQGIAAGHGARRSEHVHGCGCVQDVRRSAPRRPRAGRPRWGARAGGPRLRP